MKSPLYVIHTAARIAVASLIAIVIAAAQLTAQNVVRRPGTLSEISRPSTTIIPPSQSSQIKKKQYNSGRRRRSKTASAIDTIEVKIYSDPNTTALNARICYDDFEGVEVCFPSCFHVVADNDNDLQLLFQDANDANMAMLQFKRYDYTNSIHDLATVKTIFETIPGAQVTNGAEALSCYAVVNGQNMYSKAFMHNGEVIMCMLTFADAVKPSMEDFIPLLSRIFHP